MDNVRIPPAGDPIYAAGQTTRGPAGSTTREERGLALFRECAEEIKHVRGPVWSVPSCNRAKPGVYLVDLADGICTCGDIPPSAEACKHQVAATIARAKSGVCVGCGVRARRRDLHEVTEDHESLTFFVGDELCEECAGAHGVL